MKFNTFFFWISICTGFEDTVHVIESLIEHQQANLCKGITSPLHGFPTNQQEISKATLLFVWQQGDRIMNRRQHKHAMTEPTQPDLALRVKIGFHIQLSHGVANWASEKPLRCHGCCKGPETPLCHRAFCFCLGQTRAKTRASRSCQKLSLWVNSST